MRSFNFRRVFTTLAFSCILLGLVTDSVLAAKARNHKSGYRARTHTQTGKSGATATTNFTLAFQHKPSANFQYAEVTTEERGRIRITNIIDGAVEYSTNYGRTWTKIGKVLQPNYGNNHEIQDYEFTAADWAPVAAIAATAVNAIHVKVAQNHLHATAFSIHPKDVYISTANQSYQSSEAAVFLDIPAGYSIFGSGMSPHIGDPIYKQKSDGTLLKWQANEALATGDVMVIVTHEPKDKIAYFEFENQWGGMVSMKTDKGVFPIARVFRPVKGSGRFGGSQYQDQGLVRANHPGVICVSTGPRGVLGGFQIVPCFHANEPSLEYVLTTTVYMVIGALNYDQRGLEGMYPLFSGVIRSGSRVEARVSGTWGPMPAGIGLNQSAFKTVEAIRIYPIQDFNLAPYPENANQFEMPSLSRPDPRISSGNATATPNATSK